MMVLLLLAVSWILLLLEKKGLGELTGKRPALHLREFGLGFVVMGGAAAVQQIGFSLAAGVAWQFNSSITAGAFWTNLRWNIISALVEELLFRGYLLYLAIRLLGPRQAVWIAGTVFGIYHWFSYGIVGNPAPMAYVFILTGSFGLMGATAFATTRSMAAQTGLHLGWNLISYLVFSTGPLGPALLIPADGNTRLKPPGGAGLLLAFAFPLAVIGGVIWYLHWRASRRQGETQIGAAA